MEQDRPNGTITIYRLTLETWNDRSLSDFNLPRIIGHYITERLALEARTRHIQRQRLEDNPEDHTTERDYEVRPIYVHTRNPRENEADR